jgi:hypothetical protein
MSERDAGRLCRLLDQHELRYWVVGGWGVDALLGEVTREHNDLDLLLVGSQHATTWRLLHDHGFALAYTWEENVDVPGDLVEGTQPTAYVLRDSEGRELDVHVLDECEGVPRAPLVHRPSARRRRARCPRLDRPHGGPVHLGGDAAARSRGL